MIGKISKKKWEKKEEKLKELKLMFSDQISTKIIETLFIESNFDIRNTVENLIEMSIEKEKSTEENMRFEDKEDFSVEKEDLLSWFKNGFRSFLMRDDPFQFTDKGLSNYNGENNCFLNVVIQILWHLHSFSDHFGSISKHEHKGNNDESCTFCALKIIFTQFEFSECSEVPPTVLRKALSTIYQTKFQEGEMDDAAEVYDALLTCLHNCFVGNNKCCNPPCVIHEVFSWKIKEKLNCKNCTSFTQFIESQSFINYCHVEALRKHASQTLYLSVNENINYGVSLATTIKKLNDMDSRSCPVCHISGKIERDLINSPRILTIGFVWETNLPQANHIQELIKLIDTKIPIKKIFDSVPNSSTIFVLRCMICYWLKHYIAFIKNSKTKEWIMFDDETVKHIGKWKNVMTNCDKGHKQPFLLFYEMI